MKSSRNPAYLRFIRRQPCCVCGRSWGARPPTPDLMAWGKHRQMDRAFRCAGIHHRGGRDSYHNLGRVRFSETHNLDILAIILSLTSEHENKNSSNEFMGQAAGRNSAPREVNREATTAMERACPPARRCV